MRFPDLEAAGDEELVRSFVATRDQDALAVLLRRHQARVWGLAYRLLADRSDASDASQEVFITVFRKAHQFRHHSTFSTWLYRLTVNACRDLARKRVRVPVPADRIEKPIDHTLDQVDQRLAIEAALKGLLEEQRLAIVLRDLHGLTYAEIAEVTGAPVGTVKSRIARGRLALAAALGEPAPGAARLNDREPT